jgi:carboxymethylenebutenolidase
MWLLLIALIAPGAYAAGITEQVEFPSRDGTTQLTGYVFYPATPPPWPAVVMLHGRSGPYSTAARGVYAAHTLSLRHKQWGAFWAEQGYLALHVDSFGPRGYPQGFPFGSCAVRRKSASNRCVPDAYALRLSAAVMSCAIALVCRAGRTAPWPDTTLAAQRREP